MHERTTGGGAATVLAFPDVCALRPVTNQHRGKGQVSDVPSRGGEIHSRHPLSNICRAVITGRECCSKYQDDDMRMFTVIVHLVKVSLIALTNASQ